MRKLIINEYQHPDEFVPIYLNEDQIFILRDLVMNFMPMCTAKNDLISVLASGLLRSGSNYSFHIRIEKDVMHPVEDD